MDTAVSGTDIFASQGRSSHMNRTVFRLCVRPLVQSRIRLLIVVGTLVSPCFLASSLSSV